MKLGIARFVFHYLIYAAARTNHGVYARGVLDVSWQIASGTMFRFAFYLFQGA
jgi:hypothetical protein